ncbi:MAG: hypothetical protein ACI8XM_003007 [Haloarculaceae archaeon]|jgi:hypothetical protein
MSATPESEREPLSTSFSQEARSSGIASATARGGSTTVPLRHLDNFEDELLAAAFDLEGRR